MFVHMVVKLERYFLNQQLDTLRSMTEVQKMNQDVKRDVNWFFPVFEPFQRTYSYTISL